MTDKITIEREKFHLWWEAFQAEHEEWRFADREAILFAVWSAALAQNAVAREREQCAKICDEARQTHESAAALADADDRPALLSTAWRIGLIADAIRRGE